MEIKYEPFTQMGMNLIIARYKEVLMTIAEGEDWICIYSCDSSNQNKGQVQEMIKKLRKDYPTKVLNGSVPLHPAMEHIYKKMNISY